ncbi:tRNA dimethylallyltransferase [Diorhabda sublineata]|uniref:tRNA dimethylallyltransferase n=1 Tax=Diorhabda sublineata TaxID=1163346 RepID=UPI0024E09A55|nr:tRNA dimethylallyltransferase [Diorhabda sublineata]
MSPRLPLVVILGATGSGKTKLSLELAKLFSGEIIGADSMQVYKSLDIITAKATKEEQSAAPHHLIDILNPNETFTVVEYKKRALGIIETLLKNRKLPIVVGGTNYYIESLLWKILIDDSEYSKIPGLLPNNDHELPSEELHKKLKSLDPVMAKRLHPNNKRKILRSLEILYKRGKKHSEFLEEQQASRDGSKSGGGLRFSNSVVLWLQCDQEILDKRLDDRVDDMLKQGLVNELLEFHKIYNEKRLISNEEADYTKGIFQSIGFKEFHPFLILNENEKNSEEGQKKLKEGIEQLKMATRRYARKQKRWILNRFLGRQDRQVPPIYGLDTSDVSQWEDKVSKKAEQIVRSFINNTRCCYESLPKQKVDSNPNSEDITFTCEICDRVFVGQFQWTVHLKSNKHKKMLESKHKKEKKKSYEIMNKEQNYSFVFLINLF